MNDLFKIIKLTSFVRMFFYANLFNLLFSFEFVFAAPFQYQYRSARYLGRGDAGIASVFGADSMFYNPAGIAQGTGNFRELVLVSPQIEGSENLKTAYDQKEKSDEQALTYLIQNKNTPFYAAGQNVDAVVFKKFAIGAMQRGEVDIELKEDPYTGQPFLALDAKGWNGGYVSLAHDMYDGHILIGITGKAVQKTQYNLNMSTLQIASQLQNNTLAETIKASGRKGNALGADLGSMVILDKETETQLGLVVRNIGMEYKWAIPENSRGPDNDPQQVDIGTSTSFGTRRGRVKLFADYRDIYNQQNQQYLKHTHLGVEYNLVNTLIVMSGLNQGYLTYGFALNLKIIRLEGGIYTEEMGDYSGQIASKHYFARVSLGWLL